MKYYCFWYFSIFFMNNLGYIAIFTLNLHSFTLPLLLPSLPLPPPIFFLSLLFADTYIIALSFLIFLSLFSFLIFSPSLPSGILEGKKKGREECRILKSSICDFFAFSFFSLFWGVLAGRGRMGNIIIKKRLGWDVVGRRGEWEGKEVKRENLLKW